MKPMNLAWLITVAAACGPTPSSELTAQRPVPPTVHGDEPLQSPHFWRAARDPAAQHTEVLSPAFEVGLPTGDHFEFFVIPEEDSEASSVGVLQQVRASGLAWSSLAQMAGANALDLFYAATTEEVEIPAVLSQNYERATSVPRGWLRHQVPSTGISAASPCPNSVLSSFAGNGTAQPSMTHHFSRFNLTLSHSNYYQYASNVTKWNSGVCMQKVWPNSSLAVDVAGWWNNTCVNGNCYYVPGPLWVTAGEGAALQWTWHKCSGCSKRHWEHGIQLIHDSPYVKVDLAIDWKR